jgi:hypothetical protein
MLGEGLVRKRLKALERWWRKSQRLLPIRVKKR